MSDATVETDWRFARAWLAASLETRTHESRCGQRIYADFEAAVNSDPAGRAALLEELGAGDAELRGRSRAAPHPGRGGGAGRLPGDPGLDTRCTATDSSTGGKIRSTGRQAWNEPR